jgi:hypothetical protein
VAGRRRRLAKGWKFTTALASILGLDWEVCEGCFPFSAYKKLKFASQGEEQMSQTNKLNRSISCWVLHFFNKDLGTSQDIKAMDKAKLAHPRGEHLPKRHAKKFIFP